MRSFTLLIVQIVVCLNVTAQIFTNQSNFQGIDIPVGETNFGNGISMFDYNRDGWDDLTVGTKANGTYLYRNNAGAFELDTILPNLHEGKSVCWGDYNADGFPDLFVGTLGGPCQLWRNNGLTYEEVSEEMNIPTDPLAETYGSAWCDYDRDGDLDLYITNYNQGAGPGNWLLNNQGGLIFEEVAATAGVDNDVVWSFMPVFADFNNDGWPDLYVINDKLASNALFRNNGDGTFSDVSVGSNTDFVVDAMSNSVIDYDNDGDLDIYVTNDYSGNRMLRNDGDFQFTDVTEVSGLAVNQFCWGALWIDFDNNTEQDLFVCTTDYLDDTNIFYRNVGDGQFGALPQTFNISNHVASHSAARCDFNKDGSADILQANYGDQGVYLWKNEIGYNNWIGVELEPTVSNPQAFGTWVKACLGGSCYSKYTLSSDAYLSQHAQRLLFGIKQTTTVDSLVIEWPSGHTDVILNPEVNVYHEIQEGSSIASGLESSHSVLCAGEDVTLLVSDHFEGATWSTGDEGLITQVDMPGWYAVEAIHPTGIHVVDSIYVAEATDANIVVETTDVSCYGSSDGVASVTADLVVEIEWPNGGQGMTVGSWNPGTYSFTATTDEGCSTEHSFTIDSPDPLELFIEESMPLCSGDANGSLQLSAAGGFGEYTYEPDDFIHNLPAGDYPLTLIDANGCTVDTVFTLIEPEPVSVEVSTLDAVGETPGSAEAFASGGLPPYSINWSNGASGALNAPLDAGAYSVIVVDQNSCVTTLGFTIDQVVGVNELVSAKLIAWPVPLNDQLTIDGVKVGETLTVTNAFGQVVFSTTIETTDSFTIAVAHWASGSYVLRLHGDETRILQLVK